MKEDGKWEGVMDNVMQDKDCSIIMTILFKEKYLIVAQPFFCATCFKQFFLM